MERKDRRCLEESINTEVKLMVTDTKMSPLSNGKRRRVVVKRHGVWRTSLFDFRKLAGSSQKDMLGSGVSFINNRTGLKPKLF